MKYAYLYILLATSFMPFAAIAGGGEPARNHVNYVSGDSVSVEDVFLSRLLSEYMGNDSTMRPQTLALTKKERKKLISDSAAWKKDIAENLTLWGESSVSAVDNFYAAAKLFLTDPRHEYADIVERTLYNGVIAGLDTTENTDVRHRAAQAVLDATGMTYATCGTDVYVNLYFRNRAYIHNDSLDLVILQNTSAPWKSDVFFALKFASGEQSMRLHLRLPAWLRGEVIPGGKYSFDTTREFYQVLINGKPSTVRAQNGYITLSRTWKSDDVVRLTMKTPVRRIRETNATEKNRFALQRGPIVYAYSGDEFVRFFRTSDPVGSIYDKDVLHTNMLVVKMYTSQDTTAETPWDCNLYPYYMLKSVAGSEQSVWLDEQK